MKEKLESSIENISYNSLEHYERLVSPINQLLYAEPNLHLFKKYCIQIKMPIVTVATLILRFKAAQIYVVCEVGKRLLFSYHGFLKKS